MTDGRFPPVQAVFSADLCDAFFFELAEEDCSEHAHVFHPCDVASPAQLHLKQDGVYAGQAGSLVDFFV